MILLVRISFILFFIFLSACSLFDSDAGKIKTLVNKHWSAGTHIISWDQKNEDGDRVSTGKYKAKVKCSNYSSSASFSISSSAEHVPLSTCSPESTGELPAQYSITTSSDNYARGDTVCIIVSSPEQTKVELWIEEK